MFAFVDESGFPKPNDDSLYSVLMSICVPRREIRNLTRRVYSLMIDTFGDNHNTELKAKKYVRPKSLKPNRSNNKDLVEKIIELVEIFPLKSFAIIMERPDFSPYVKPDFLPLHYKFLLQRLDNYSIQNNTITSVIFDEQDQKTDESIARGFNNLLYRSHEIEQIIEMPLFVSSKITAGLQLADIFAGIVRHYYNLNLDHKKPEGDFETWIYDLFQRVKNTTIDFRNGYTTYGYYYMNKNHFPKETE